MARKKVAYVAGVLEDWRHLSMFENLRDFEVEVHAISQKEILSHYRSNLKLFIYENVTDMPGYMRGIEERISDSNIIVSREISRLSTFQATRIGQKYDIPSIVLVSETRPNFYKSYNNISAIQNDILSSSTGFVAMSKHSDAMLDFYNVPENKKMLLNPTLPSLVPTDIDTRSVRFRRRTGVKDDELLVGVFSNVDNSFKGDVLFGALKMLKAKDPYQASKLKIVVVGNGENSQQLKYLAFEMGIGQQVLFIHEDYQIYYLDLMCAFDYVLHLEPNPQHLIHHEPYPRYLLDAVACKSLALVRTGSVAKELLGESCKNYDDDSEYSLANTFSECLDRHSTLSEVTSDHSKRVIELYSCEPIRAVMNNLLNSFVEGAASESNVDRFNLLKSDIELSIIRAEFTNALIGVEKGMLNFEGNSKYQSYFWKIKGDIFNALSRSDDAVDAYAKSLDYDSKNTGVYLALGLVSFHGQSYVDAITFYKKALGLDSENIEAKIGLGMSHFRNNMHNEAMYWLKKAVLSEGNDGKSLTALIQAASDCPNPAMGVSALEGVLDSIGESSRLLMALGRMYMKAGQSDKGHVLVQKALLNEPGAA